MIPGRDSFPGYSALQTIKAIIAHLLLAIFFQSSLFLDSLKRKDIAFRDRKAINMPRLCRERTKSEKFIFLLDQALQLIIYSSY
jgi:hypothetical protein